MGVVYKATRKFEAVSTFICIHSFFSVTCVYFVSLKRKSKALFIYGQKLSRLARKHFEEFTSEISPCYENNMKSYIVFIWDKTFPVYRDLAC